MSIVVATTVSARREHALVTVPSWAADPQVERIVVADWGCPDGTGAALEDLWAKQKPPAELEVVRSGPKDRFHKMGAWNLGRSRVLAGCEDHVLLLDIDDLRLKPLPSLLHSIVVSWEAYGLCGMPRWAYERLGPFEESFVGYGTDDLWIRLWLLLGERVEGVADLPLGTFLALQHTEAAKASLHDEKNPLRSNIRNLVRLDKLMRARFGMGIADDAAIIERWGMPTFTAVRRLCNETYDPGWRHLLAGWAELERANKVPPPAAP